jgi:hypothetical protein
MQADVSPTLKNIPELERENSKAVRDEKLPTTTVEVVTQEQKEQSPMQTPATVQESVSTSTIVSLT